MGNPTTNCRIYPTDNTWIMKHRSDGSTAEVISKLIKYHERSKSLLEEGDLI